MEQITKFELTQQFHDRFQQALSARDKSFIAATLEEVNPADITALLYEFNSEESKFVLDLLPVPVRAQIINDLDTDTRKKFLTIYTPTELTEIINQLDSDDVADILNELPIQVSEEIIGNLEPDLKLQVIDLLRYDEHVAGGLMAKELIRVRANWTVGECLDEIRKQAETVTKFYTAWVVDDKDKLLGQVSLQKLIVSDPKTLVENICDENIVRVGTYVEDREVVEIMKKYDLESIPVVNVQGQLVGRITIDDVVDVISEQVEEERQLMSGITEDVEENDDLWKNVRARLPWLLIGIFGGMLSARFMGFFQQELTKITAIAFFVPLIQATGGNVGIQSSGLVVQSLASPGYLEEGLWQRLIKMFYISFLNAFLLSLIVLGSTYLFFNNNRLSVVVSIALFCVVMFSSFVGTITPILINRLGFNPALASGPFITTASDLLGLTTYFLTVHVLL
ncbi:MAG: magnesium transporter [Bacteroidetes bacterium]|nr:magnesium transporter [Bacteroidota bacterium]MBS1539782.1 magnesium transporter [Bacteroidota bacterium]